ncbi:MAG: Uma2 family endonuclease [Waterburya sp.]
MFTDNLNLPISRDRLTQSDQILILPGLTWEDYEQLISQDSNYLISYFKNKIIIVSPTRNHERLAEIIHDLINAYCRKYSVKYWALGSEDIKKEPVVGKQPDKSYCFETLKDSDTRDLAIEVNYTSGSIADLEKYKALEVREVWFWEKNQINFYWLEDDNYLLISKSKTLNKISSALLTQFVNRSLTSEDNLTIQTQFFDQL